MACHAIRQRPNWCGDQPGRPEGSDRQCYSARRVARRLFRDKAYFELRGVVIVIDLRRKLQLQLCGRALTDAVGVLHYQQIYGNPRMDEIFTAIRRAITDMDVESAPRVVGASVVPPEHPVLDEPPASASIDPAPPQVPPSPPLGATSEQAQGAASPTSDEETKQAAGRNAATVSSRGPEAGLLSRETSAAVGSAFSTLAHAVRKQNSQTLEDLVRETLYPRLTSWLDDNLPGLVERMVRTEIERIASER